MVAPRSRFAVLLLILALPGLARADTITAARDTQPDTWTATDALGRSLPDAAECGPPRAGRFVGIFYFLWLPPHAGPVYDIGRILSQNPEHPAWGPAGAFHWWGEPHLGYYASDDPFVIRRHAQMLADAGVDVIIFDVTNGPTYDDALAAVCRTFEQIRREGGRTPAIAFITHAGAAAVVGHLYDTVYARGLYRDLWFNWKGRPLILSSTADLDPKLKDFFTFRESWAWTDPHGWFGDGHDRWPWLDHTPQQFGWHESPDRPEAISVAVAEHPISNIGRSFHDGHEPPAEARRTADGLYFAEQWARARKVDPEFVFVTGWNEWVAQRFMATDDHMKMAGRPLAPGDSFFVDEYSQEYSRDIEPMNGGHGDDYYCQLVANIRRYKGVRAAPRASGPLTIHIGPDFQAWAGVRPEYRDDLFDDDHRNHAGFGAGVQITNTSGRNDLDTMKVARDADHVYFYVRTREAMTEPTGDNWMLLLIDADADHRTGWAGYDFLVDRVRPSANTCTLERHVGGGWRWAHVADVPFARMGNQMQIAIPRKLLGLDQSPCRFNFKWADNVPLNGNIVDFLDQGDVAPNGRFNYAFRE